MRKRLSGRLLPMLVAAAVVVSAYVIVPLAAPAALPEAQADAPASGAFALGGGLSGSVDPRTGQFSVSIPLVNVAGRGDSGVQMGLSWEQSRAGAGLDRGGWGGGWSLGSTFIDTTGDVTVYPANGGAYATDSSYASGLRYYLLADLKFSGASGRLPARTPGGPDLIYGYTITYDDQKIDYFDRNGNLIVRKDRFGNRTDLSYVGLGDDQWRPTTITDAYGLVTRFDYNAQPNAVVITAPTRSDGVKPATTVSFFSDGTVRGVTDPVGNKTSFGYDDVTVDNQTQHLLTTAIGPAGATSTVAYAVQAYTGAASLVIASTLDVKDAGGKALMPEQTFDIDPTDDQHNYAGFPQYLDQGDGKDQLYEQADPNYTYTTMISTKYAATMSTYDAGHRLLNRTVQARKRDNSSWITVQAQTAKYPDLEPPEDQPANYARPKSTLVHYSATSGPNGVVAATGRGRSVSTTTTYDSHGRIATATDEVGTKTVNTYDPRAGLLTSTVATGKDGTTSTTTNSLDDTGRYTQTSTVAVGATAATTTARTITTYAMDGFGEPVSKTVAWAKGAAPSDNGGGPESVTTGYVSTVDPTAATRTLTTTKAVGTSAESSTTTTTDLVSGQVVAFADELGRVTSKGYDAAGRPTSVTPPTGLPTTTTYTAATRTTPATTLASTADGHKTLTSFDALGRTVKVTDNVNTKVAFVADPTTRVVSTHTYSANKITPGSGSFGVTLTSTDVAGRKTTTVGDALGRTVMEVAANGVTKTTGYDDIVNTVTRQTIADNATAASQLVKVGYDAKNRQVSSRTTYPVSGPRPLFLSDPVEATTLDGIGRPASVTESDLVTTPDYAGSGGVPVTTTVAPAKTARVQTPAITATDTTMLDANATQRSLQQAGQPARSGTALIYDAAGQLVSNTDPLGRTTSYTYADDGQLLTTTTPSGTVSTNTYDPATGRLATVSDKAADGTTLTTSYTYVAAGQPGAGEVYTVTDPSGTITYSYDADGNRTSVAYPDGSSTGNSYAASGLLQTSIDVTGAVTTYLYNTDTSLKSATQVRGTTTLASVGYTYDGLGRISTTTRGNGLTTTNTYTPNNLLATQASVDSGGNQVEAHSYAYDSHHNLTTKTDITAKPSRCTVVCAAGPTTYGIWTTTYAYDAYDRLTGSAVYSGATAAGSPMTAHSYQLDVSGNVTQTTRTTQTTGLKPTTTTLTIKDQVDATGQLTTRTTGSTSATQTFDDDGRLATSLDGATTTYRPDGLPATVAQDGATTTFSYWPDGTRRRSQTVDPTDGTSTVDFHYSPTGTLINDTTTLAAGSASASYLVTTGREARTLQPGTTPAGAKGLRAAAAPTTTGAGVGYFLRDRHSSVTALVDSSGAVTNTYAYTDYGAPALLSGQPGTVIGANGGPGAGQTNPLRYTGSALKALYTDTDLGTMMTPTRFYDPAQGRFTAGDTANVHNRYVGFEANPIMKVDPTGQSPLADFIIDAIYVVVFVIATVATGGAAAAAGAAIFGAAEATAVTAATVATFAAQSVATVANVVGLAANATRFADDVDNATSGKHFLTDDARSDFSNIATVAGSVAGVAGMFAAGAEAASTAAEDAAKLAASKDVAKAPTTAYSGPSIFDITPVGEEEATPLVELGDDDYHPLSDHVDAPESDPLSLDDTVDATPVESSTKKSPSSAMSLIPDKASTAAQATPAVTSPARTIWEKITGKATAEAKQNEPPPNRVAERIRKRQAMNELQTRPGKKVLNQNTSLITTNE